MNYSAAPSVTWSSVGKAIPMICISLLALAGNSLVVFSVATNKVIRRVPANLLVLNLAVTDMAAGLICIPLSYITVLCSNKWIFGEAICQAEAFVIVLLSNVTLLTLSSFSWYRYKTITSHYKYSKFELWRLVKCMVSAIWGISFLLALPPAFGWGEFYFSSSISTCSLNWSKDMSYSVLILVLLFIIPSSLMTVFYHKIMKFVRRHNNNFRSRRAWCNTMDSQLSCSNVDQINKAPEVIINVPDVSVQSGATTLTAETGTTSRSKSHVRVVNVIPSTSSGLAPLETLGVEDATVLEDTISQTSRVISPTLSEQSAIARFGETQKRLHQQEKLVKVLLVTILAFKVCWFPFAVYSILETLDLHVSDSSLFPLVAVWLAFSNTICNPIIYAFLNKQFKMAFRDVLRALCRVQIRSNTVQPHSVIRP
ncbi:octopamine receptor 1-like [Stylophora pistillata]|uniref:octopamine receptor 1-like n=1 Tax=Stylophora pistillata TaxID=50429 RepID=UPI000C04DBF5|nr:octopamine receptor 1-like [Stylophora pistillata]